MLTDSRILAVEYRGGHLAENAKEKRMVGELWAEASDRRCLFAMPTDKEFGPLARLLEKPWP